GVSHTQMQPMVSVGLWAKHCGKYFAAAVVRETQEFGFGFGARMISGGRTRTRARCAVGGRGSRDLHPLGCRVFGVLFCLLLGERASNAWGRLLRFCGGKVRLVRTPAVPDVNLFR